MKSVTLNGRRYRLEWDAAFNRWRVRGYGLLLPPYLPVGVGPDHPQLRAVVEHTLACERQRRIDASEAIQRRVAAGTAGLGASA